MFLEVNKKVNKTLKCETDNLDDLSPGKG